MSIAGAIEAARAAMGVLFYSDPQFVETVRIVDPADPATKILDPETFELLPANPSVVDGVIVDTDDLATYTGPAIISSESSRRERRNEGGAEQYPEAYMLRVPSDVTVQRGQLVTVVTSPRAHLVGRTFTVEQIPDRGRGVNTQAILHAAERGPRL